jgi:two-component sensor histidine kinase
MPARSGPVAVLAPVGRDAEVAADILGQAGIAVSPCPGLGEFVPALEAAAAAVVAEEALLHENRQGLADWIKNQPPWSDFPFVLLTQRGVRPDPRFRNLLGNVTIIERPFHPDVLIDAVSSALRARRRQREVEAHLREREETSERQKLLIRELHHRVKNTLATVQALLGATARSSKSIEEFYASFVGRIVALAHTHTLLTEDYWQAASLHDLLTAELRPYEAGGRRIALKGPHVALYADLAVPLGMAVHELTTNAVKYGALSSPAGRLEVSWDCVDRDEARVLVLDWQERGGPPIEGKPNGRGFGSTLIERVLTTQCNAKVDYAFAPEGVSLHVEAPLLEQRTVPPYGPE